VGGTGIKGLTADEADRPTSERVRVETPHPATPEAVVGAIGEIRRRMPPFDRVAIGFPGVVVEGIIHSAPNLDPSFAGFPLAAAVGKLTGKPVRVANDAGVQGLAVIEGKGTELVVTLGTGMGFALYIDGHYVPNIEMAHHPFRKKKTYEDLVGDRARHKAGHKRWNRRVEKVIAQLAAVFNYRLLYLGGGNAKAIDFPLPENVHVVENLAGLLGGVKLWGQP
ncbi:MAG TPA: ROK family protein, partial [Thermoanaerobaculia bacterium]